MIDKKKKIISFENTILRKDPGIVKDGYTLIECNLTEPKKETKKFIGVNNLKIINCPCYNCLFPKSAELDKASKKMNKQQDEHPVPENEINNFKEKWDILKYKYADKIKTQAEKDFNLKPK